MIDSSFVHNWLWPAGGSGGTPGDVFGTLEWAILAGVITVLIWPRVRHLVERALGLTALHAKLDHIITHHPDIPPFNPKESSMTAAYENMPRQAGKRGSRPHVHHPEMQLANFRAAAPATPPPSGDVAGGITNWGMDHNDDLSCCGYAMADHYIVAKTGDVQLIDKLGGVGLPLYFEYGVSQGETGTPPAPADQPDQGVDNPTWFTFLMDKGVIDAWAELPLNNPTEIHAAMLNFKGVCISVALTDDAEQLFNNHQPWTLANGETPDQNEGHDILLVKYDPQTDTFVTWGSLQPAMIDWDNACITGVYVFVSKEDAERNGVDIDALIATIRSLHGTVAKPPASTVPPVPQPPAPLPDTHVAWWDAVLDWIKENI